MARRSILSDLSLYLSSVHEEEQVRFQSQNLFFNPGSELDDLAVDSLAMRMARRELSTRMPDRAMHRPRLPRRRHLRQD